MHAQSKKSFEAGTVARLASQDALTRYSAVTELRSKNTLPEPVIRMLIDYLSDLRGELPGNTIAGEAAEVLAEHPRHASRAIPQLLKLLVSGEKYGLPAGSAAEALTAIKRPALEKYLTDLSSDHRKALAEALIQRLKWTNGGIVAELLGMLWPEATDAGPILEKKIAMSRKEESTNPLFRILNVRSESALRIIRSGWRVGHSGYYDEMKRADIALGKPDSKVLPADRFTAALAILVDKMNRGGVAKAYVLRKEQTFPFRLSAGLPLARLIQSTRYRFLYGSDDGKGKQLPNIPLVVLTTAAKEIHRSNYFPEMNAPYSPLVPDFAFVEMGANGAEPLDRMLKSVGVKDGYRGESL